MMFKKYFFRPSGGGFVSAANDLSKQYHELVAENRFRHDPSQLKILRFLQSLLDKLVVIDKCQQRGLVGKFITKTSAIACRHLYIYGGVGHGKSMLMDLFFAACPVTQKRRVHFHAFMQEVHAFIHQRQQISQDDVIPTLARQIRSETLLLCFDEFHVTDIADAMIMERLFRCLFDLGVIVVMTSNRHPNDLYRGGLLREQFLPFVDLLLHSARIVELAGDIDYRTIRQQAPEHRYCYPLDEQADEFVCRKFFTHSGATALIPGSIEVFGRTIPFRAVHGDTVLASFEQLCQQPLAAADYLQIAERFNTVIMSSIPKLAPEFCDAARRFEILIDALYEFRVKFICSAEARPWEIYQEGEGAFEFRRTVSRLVEMQSDAY